MTIKMMIMTLLVALAIPVGMGQGYSESRVATYDIRTLSSRPGIVYISPSYLTLIEFGELIDTVASSQAEAIQVQVSDNLLVLKSRRKAGQLDLVVQAGGRIAMFRLVVDTEGILPRRYIVTMPRPSSSHVVPPAYTQLNPPHQPQANAPATPQSTTSNTPPPPTPATPQTATPAPTPTGPNPPAIARNTPPGLPSWLKASLTSNRQNENMLIYFQLQNVGLDVVTITANNLQIRSGANALEFRLIRSAFGKEIDKIAPGEAVAGVIIVPNAPEEVTLEWSLQNATSTFTLQQNFN